MQGHVSEEVFVCRR